MYKEMADKLVAALRSGKYLQTKGSLQKSNRNCCLGVACRVAGLKAKGVRTPRFLGESSFLPFEIMEKFGFYSKGGARRDGQGLLINNTTYGSLAIANDYGVKFNDIADYIEKNYEVL